MIWLAVLKKSWLKMVEFANVLGGESKVHNGAKPCITRDNRMTFVIIGPKGLNTISSAMYMYVQIIYLYSAMSIHILQHVHVCIFLTKKQFLLKCPLCNDGIYGSWLSNTINQSSNSWMIPTCMYKNANAYVLHILYVKELMITQKQTLHTKKQPKFLYTCKHMVILIKLVY